VTGPGRSAEDPEPSVGPWGGGLSGAAQGATHPSE